MATLGPPRRHPVRRRLAIGAGALVLVAAGTALAIPAAQAATIDPNAWYQLVNRNSQLAATVSGASTANNAAVVQQAATGATDQQFHFVASAGGYYRLTARHSGKVVDVSAGSTADGASVIQYTDNDAVNQQFSVVDTGGYVKLINHNSGKALEIYQASTAAGARLSQSTGTSAANQQWQLVAVGSSTPTTAPTTAPTSQPPTKTLTIPNNLGTHDPSRIVNDNGSYFFYSTGGNIPGWYTTDGHTWKQTPAVFPNGIPASVHNQVPANDGHDVWAPDVLWNPYTKLFDLYYSVANWNVTDRSAIGLATSPTLNPSSSGYKWTDRGVVIAKSPSYTIVNAVDPAPFFDTSGNLWLSFGSGYGSDRANAVNIIALDRNTGLRSDSVLHTVLSCGCEGSYVLPHGGYYYLFWNTGGCCSGASSTYTIHVARSTSPTGPYTERSSTFRASSAGVHGPGHLGVLTENGRDLYTFHYYPDTGGSVLGSGFITWKSDGWPYS